MIQLTRLNGKSMHINIDMIKFVESTPDTQLTLMTGEILHVLESADEVIESFVNFKRRINAPESGLDRPPRALEIP